MRKIKALEMLREKIRLDVNNPWTDLQGNLLSMCNKVESEIEEFYMPLPLDVDGVPIRVGDIVEKRGHTGKVWMIGMNEFMCTDRVCYSMRDCSHIKARTLEDVLRDCARDYHDTLSWFEAGESTGLSPHEIVEKYADEIRDLMEG